MKYREEEGPAIGHRRALFSSFESVGRRRRRRATPFRLRANENFLRFRSTFAPTDPIFGK